VAQSITVGIVAFPNVGKGSLINTLKRAKVRTPSCLDFFFLYLMTRASSW
jgi:ribosome biogenesis GTPase A